jgi:aspartyl-tRNA(Asn)/glutamyl-tRNA(Gln) amidotransferase subunit B
MFPRIGLEVHVELNTKSKMFCPCPVGEWEEPNVAVCPICLAHPGSLPVPNRTAVVFAISLGLALKGEISRVSHFYRKNYFYPDLPKGYQITQYSVPIVRNAWILGKRIERINLEEETAKSLHLEDGTVLLDFNRAGIPLLEIVFAPEISSPEEAKEVLRALQSAVRYLGISSADMEKGQFRVDVNVSISASRETFGTKVEIKNLNSFKAIADAIEYEIKRQSEIIMGGGRVIQETRMWNGKETEPMRTKETESDYRYFPEPDIPPLLVDESIIEEAKVLIKEMPWEKEERYISLGVPKNLAKIIAYDLELSQTFDSLSGVNPKMWAEYLVNVIVGRLNQKGKTLRDFDVEGFGKLLEKVERGEILEEYLKVAVQKNVFEGVPFERLIEEAPKPVEIDLESLVDELIKNNPQQVEKYKKGQKGVVGFFVGQIMKDLRGKVDPKRVSDVVVKKLEES